MAPQISEFLSRELKERSISQSDLARNAGLGTASISKWLSGTAVPDEKSCLKIAVALRDDPIRLLKLAGHNDFAELLQKFLPAEGRELTEIDLYQNPEHAELHLKLQGYLSVRMERTVRSVFEQLDYTEAKLWLAETPTSELSEVLKNCRELPSSVQRILSMELNRRGQDLPNGQLAEIMQYIQSTRSPKKNPQK